jgi:hypothetical protein
MIRNLNYYIYRFHRFHRLHGLSQTIGSIGFIGSISSIGLMVWLGLVWFEPSSQYGSVWLGLTFYWFGLA